MLTTYLALSVLKQLAKRPQEHPHAVLQVRSAPLLATTAAARRCGVRLTLVRGSALLEGVWGVSRVS